MIKIKIQSKVFNEIQHSGEIDLYCYEKIGKTKVDLHCYENFEKINYLIGKKLRLNKNSKELKPIYCKNKIKRRLT